MCCLCRSNVHHLLITLSLPHKYLGNLIKIQVRSHVFVILHCLFITLDGVNNNFLPNHLLFTLGCFKQTHLMKTVLWATISDFLVSSEVYFDKTFFCMMVGFAAMSVFPRLHFSPTKYRLSLQVIITQPLQTTPTSLSIISIHCKLPLSVSCFFLFILPPRWSLFAVHISSVSWITQ